MTDFLIIDDDDSFVSVLGAILRSLFKNCKILRANSVSEARQVIENLGDNSGVIVLLDENLGDGLGSDLIESGILNGFEVVSMSSEPNPMTIFKTLSGGAVYFIPKSELSQKSFRLFLLGLVSSIQVRRKQRELEVFFNNLVMARRLVANLQHELNNPLSAILGSLQLLSMPNTPDEEKARLIQLFNESFFRITNYINQLKELVNRGELERLKDPR
ncbi:MAG: histidine kinase dimerization/phospho-acceptor domain-containing protein [Thermoplasmatales archaeon]